MSLRSALAKIFDDQTKQLLKQALIEVAIGIIQSKTDNFSKQGLANALLQNPDAFVQQFIHVAARRDDINADAPDSAFISAATEILELLTQSNDNLKIAQATDSLKMVQAAKDAEAAANAVAAGAVTDTTKVN